MRVINLSFKKPAKNLAYDEVLLDAVESKRVPETLRFWESPEPFVVLGVSQALRDHVYERACREDNIPILRRCSAGGCVLQGPGCLNFALVLRHEKRPELKTVRGSYCFILGAVSNAFAEHDLDIRHRGISDLVMGNLKVSGNAQRRRKKAILHHGTLLYKPFNLDMSRYLREPDDRPRYRGRRCHNDFLATIPLSKKQLMAVIQQAFNVAGRTTRAAPWELERAAECAAEKYAAAAWIRRR